MARRADLGIMLEKGTDSRPSEKLGPLPWTNILVTVLPPVIEKCLDSILGWLTNRRKTNSIVVETDAARIVLNVTKIADVKRVTKLLADLLTALEAKV